MSEWLQKSLGELVEIRVSNVDKKSSEGELPVRLCNYMDVYSSDYVDDSSPFMRATANPAEIRRFGLRDGDVVITKDSESPDDIAVPAYVSGVGEDVVCGYHLAILRPTGLVDGKYLSYLLRTEAANRHFARTATGSTRYGLSIGSIESAPLNIPSCRQKQRRIADLLSAVDEQIRLLEAAAAKESVRALALMQAVLPAGFDVANPPKSRLADALLGIEAGKSFMCSDTPAPEGTWGVLKVSAVRPDGFVSGENKLVEDLALVNPRYEVADGDLLMTRANTPELVGAACYVVMPQPRLLLCDKTLRLRPKSGVLPQYLWLWLQTPVARRHVDAHATGTSAGMKNISQAAIRGLPLEMPSPEEQAKLVRPVVALYEHIHGLQSTLQKLRKLKSGLAAKLLCVATVDA